MSESPSSSNPAPIFGARTLVVLASVLLGGMLLQSILAIVDRHRVSKLEAFSENTAVGDSVFFKIPSPTPAAPLPVVRIGGETLVTASYDKFPCRDTKMVPVARDPVTKLTVYQCRDLPPDTAREPNRYVKTAPNEYLPLRRASGAGF